jgi:integrase
MCFRGLLLLGVRRGELEKITWDKVNMRDKTVRVYGEKTNKWRTIPISNALFPFLEQEYKMAGSRAHVFCRENGEPANKHLYRTLMRMCKEVGIETSDVTLHSFRHTFIQRLLQAGVNFKTIMTWSGHSDIKTFMVYLNQYQPVPEDINKADFGFLSAPAEDMSLTPNKCPFPPGEVVTPGR